MQKIRLRIAAEVIPYVFGGQKSLADLRNEGYPYSTRSGNIAFGRNTYGGDAAIIQQGGIGSPGDHTGDLRKAISVRIRRTPNRIQVNVEVDPSQKQLIIWLTQGTSKMIKRPVIARIEQRSRKVADQEITALIRSIPKKV